MALRSSASARRSVSISRKAPSSSFSRAASRRSRSAMAARIIRFSSIGALSCVIMTRPFPIAALNNQDKRGISALTVRLENVLNSRGEALNAGYSGLAKPATCDARRAGRQRGALSVTRVRGKRPARRAIKTTRIWLGFSGLRDKRRGLRKTITRRAKLPCAAGSPTAQGAQAKASPRWRRRPRS